MRGLFRTESVFLENEIPSEDEYLESTANLEVAAPLPLPFEPGIWGGQDPRFDRPEKEENLMGFRLFVIARHPDVFLDQLRAILRAPTVLLKSCFRW